MDEHLFVVAEAVEKIKNGEFSCFVSVIAGRQDHAIVHRMREDFAGQRVALDARGCGEQRRTDKE